jgi:ankyrin repeat protein
MDFIEAAKKGDVPLIIELINKGADIDALDKDGNTALMYAVRNNYVWLAKILIKAGIDVNAQDAVGRTALMWTTLYNYPLQMAELLIEGGADVNIEDKTGRTVFDFAIREDKFDLINLLKKSK